MSVLDTDDWGYFQNHLKHWQVEMLLPREFLAFGIELDSARKHKDRVNEILDKMVLILKGKPVQRRDAFFAGFFSTQDNPWRTLLPILFYLECERSDIGRLMMAHLKIIP